MNFEAWQSQQRAQKEAERKRKTDAAATLHQYRSTGMSEADRQLAAAKEAERQRKLAAERMMHEYRGAGMTEAEARLAAQKELDRQQKLNAERGLHGYRGGAIPGENGKTDVESTVYPEIVSPTYDDPSKAITPGAVSTMKNMFSGSGMPVFDQHTSTVGQYSTPGSTENGSSVNDVTANMSEMRMAAQPQSDNTHISDPSSLSQPSEPTMTDQPQMLVPEPSPPAPVPVPVTENVAFQIGLILVTSEPSSMDPYVATAADIVQGVISRDPALSNVTAAYPVVQNVSKDDTYVDPMNRPGVSKYRVTMAVAVTGPDANVWRDARQKILFGMRQGIQSGAFESM